MDYGIKVAKEGKDITSTDPRDYRFHSGINILKIFKEGFGTKSVAHGVVGTVDVTHNLGYKPMVFSYFKHPSNGHWYSAPCRTYEYGGSATWDLMSVMKHTSNNQIQIRLYDGDPAMPLSPTNVNYKYYILADPRENDWYLPASSDTDNGSYSDDYGFKISRPGIDVKTAEPKNLVFSTAFNTFKEYRIIKMTTAGSSVNHGLNYPPTFLAVKEDYFHSGEFIRGDVTPFINGSYPEISVDDTKVYYSANAYETIYVILFIDPLNE